ncbi:hypothetical protein JOQ06_014454, partial [Pogonophryne albipinna]
SVGLIFRLWPMMRMRSDMMLLLLMQTFLGWKESVGLIFRLWPMMRMRSDMMLLLLMQTFLGWT